ncbi:diguanylate cyclase domain-containing protein [Pengzhenrongella phosphoraccumulans]|uniref:diguanylate cyclase domain-containing protein n=1 Tax=Pengzhenrongella phosphoraccumulans TaxID=3114394 RepID=UPI0038902B1C
MSRPLPPFVDVPVVGAEPASPAIGSIARPAGIVRSGSPAPTALRLLRDQPELQALVVTDEPDADTVGTLTRERLSPDMGHVFGSAFRKARHLVTGRALVVDADTTVLTAARQLAGCGSPLPDLVVRGEVWGWVPAAELLGHVVRAFQDAAAGDPISGVMNRDSLDLTLEAWCNTIVHTTYRLVAVVLRAEGLEVVNEIAGRAAGDVVVAQVVAQIVKAAPVGAFVGRVGGGEIVVLGVMPDTAAHRVGSEVETLRQVITTAANTPTQLPAHLSRVRWPTVRSGVSVSARGSADPEQIVDDARLNLRKLTAAPAPPRRRDPNVPSDLRRSTEESRRARGQGARNHKFLTGVAAPPAQVQVQDAAPGFLGGLAAGRSGSA